MVSMNILYLLNDVISNNTCKQLLSYKQFYDLFQSNDTLSQSNVIDDLETIIKQNLENIDIFNDFTQSINNVFIDDNKMNYNNINGPVRITKFSRLGLFLRHVSIIFDTLSFHQFGCIYDNIKQFLSNDIPISSSSFTSTEQLPYLIGRSNDFLELLPEMHLDTSNQLLFQYHKHYLYQNNYNIEEYLHRYYDYYSFISDPMLLQSPNNVHNENYEKLLNNAVASYHLSYNSNYHTITKHQNALLHQTLYYLSINSYELARNSLEEGLQIAYQKNDSVTIIKLFICLYHIYLHNNTSNSLESLLLKSLSNCSNQQLNCLSSQIILLVILYRLDKQLVYYHSNDMTSNHSSTSILSFNLTKYQRDFISSKYISLPNDMKVFNIQLIWYLLLSAQYGNSNLSNILARQCNISTVDSEVSNLHINHNTTNNKSNNNQNNNIDSCVTSNEYIYNLIIPFIKVNIEMWHRLGCIDIIYYKIKHYLICYSKYFSNIQIIQIICQCIEYIYELIGIQISLLKKNSNDVTTVVSKVINKNYNTINEIIRSLNVIFPNELPDVISNTIQYMNCFNKSFYYYYSNDYEKSLNNIIICIDLTKPLDSDVNNQQNGVSSRYIRTMLLYCKILEYIDISAAKSNHNIIQNYCNNNSQLLLYHYISVIQLTHLNIKNKLIPSADCLIEYRKAIKASELIGLPILAAYIDLELFDRLLHEIYPDISYHSNNNDE